MDHSAIKQVFTIETTLCLLSAKPNQQPFQMANLALFTMQNPPYAFIA